MRLIIVLLLSAAAACAQESHLWTPLKTYTDTARGVSFQYPASWEAETQFGYCPGALSSSETKPVAGFGFMVGQTANKPTDILEENVFISGFGIVYSAVPAASAVACNAMATKFLEGQTSGKTKRIRLGGITYTSYDASVFATSKHTEGTLYATFRQKTCLLFETDEAFVATAMYDEDDVRT